MIGFICPACRKQIEVEIAHERVVTTFCPSCDALLDSPMMSRAGIARRFGALLLDVALFWIPFFLGGAFTGSEAARFQSNLWTTSIYGLFSLWFFSQGKTIGKWLLGLRVVRKTGFPVGLEEMLFRELLGKLMFEGFFLYLPFLRAIWDRDSQCWHDRGSDTVVVRKNNQRQDI